jgi:hypothetical protein
VLAALQIINNDISNDSVDKQSSAEASTCDELRSKFPDFDQVA